MRVDSWRRAPLALLVLGLSLSAVGTGCGGSRPIRIGVLSACRGPGPIGFSSPEYAGAELPLLERGATLATQDPSGGIRGATAAGHKVELHLGCSGGYSSSDLAEARKLVEREKMDILIGAGATTGGMAMRDYAKRHSGVTFLSPPAAFQSTTLRQPAANVFDFYLDGTQLVAGLGAYVYRQGWRRAIVIGDDVNAAYGPAAGVVAEFCALGGDVVKRIWAPYAFADPAAIAEAVPRRGVDGIFYMSFNGSLLIALANRLPLLRGGLGGKIVGLTFPFLADPSVQKLGDRLVGVVFGAGGVPVSSTRRAWKAYAARFAKFFPKLPLSFGLFGFAIGYYNSMAAVLLALDKLHGDLSGGEKRFRSELAKAALDAPNGDIGLDGNRQAIGPAYLDRFEQGSGGGLTYRTFATVRDVDQTFGGLFSPASPPPGRTNPPCRRGNPPPWAR